MAAGDRAAGPDEVLAFWFGGAAGDDFASRNAIWFRKDDAFDAAIRDRFAAIYAEAVAGHLSAWEDEPRSALALAIVLDQFPRNMFRGTPRAFATDPLALAVAKRAIARGFDTRLQPVERLFLYLPFEHSESLADQERSVALLESLEDPNSLDYAERHRAIVARFGRFPHRNAILGRASTPEEIAFLKEPDSSF